jgi:hypothetical protein
MMTVDDVRFQLSQKTRTEANNTTFEFREFLAFLVLNYTQPSCWFCELTHLGHTPCAISKPKPRHNIRCAPNVARFEPPRKKLSSSGNNYNLSLIVNISWTRFPLRGF